jgi:hypothetical protein
VPGTIVEEGDRFVDKDSDGGLTGLDGGLTGPDGGLTGPDGGLTGPDGGLTTDISTV